MTYKSIAWVWAVLLLFCTEGVAQTPLKTSKVLETLQVSTDHAFQLGVLPCIKKKDKIFQETRTECPIAVNLLKGNKKAGQETLPIPAWSNKFRQNQVSISWGAELYNAEPLLKIYESGDENDYVGVLARKIQLGSNINALLVTQLAGFERLIRNHNLYIIEKNKLRKIWSYSEGNPPNDAFSTVYPVVGQERPFLLFSKTGNFWEESHEYDWNKSFNFVEMTMLHVNQDYQVESTELPSEKYPLYSIVTGSYSSVEEAKESVSKIDCDNFSLEENRATGTHSAYIQFLVLKSETYPDLSSENKFITGELFFSKDEAEKFQKALGRCTPAPDSKIIKLNRKR